MKKVYSIVLSIVLLLSLSMSVSAAPKNANAVHEQNHKVILHDYIPRNSQPFSIVSEDSDLGMQVYATTKCTYCGGKLTTVKGGKHELNMQCGHWVYWDGKYCTPCQGAFDQVFYMKCSCWG